MLQEAASGHFNFNNAVADRLEGKPTQKIEDVTPRPKRRDYSQLTDDELREYERLASKVRTSAATTEES